MNPEEATSMATERAIYVGKTKRMLHLFDCSHFVSNGVLRWPPDRATDKQLSRLPVCSDCQRRLGS
jgi:hypothetical protein